MSRYNFNGISSHPEIVIEICKYLTFDDQLRLSRVSGYLRSVFESYIWKEKYVTLQLFERIDECVVSNESDVNRLCLNLKELQEFLNTYAATVRNLWIRNTVLNEESEAPDELTLGCMIVSRQLDIGQFPNIQSLRYYDMQIPKDHLKQVAELYPQLQELQLISCWMGNDFSAVIKVLVSKLRNLKICCIWNVLSCQLKYENFYEIISQRPMECLKLDAVVEPGKRMIKKNAHSFSLRELSIVVRTFDPEKWSQNYPLFLRNFKSLVILKLQVADDVTDTVLTTIAETCTELETYSLQFTTFHKIQKFSIPSKVSSLSLLSCKGITHANLREILTLHEIRKFSSTYTFFGGDFEAFQISPLIECLNIIGVVTDAIKTVFESTEHLKELTWYSERLNDNLVSSKSLASCKNLHVLDMQNCYLSTDTLLQLPHLYKLTMPHPVPFISWSYIIQLLKQPSLKELYIREFCGVANQRMNKDVSQEGFLTTNIRQMEIPLDIFEVDIRFWLDIFTMNKNLKRIRCTYEIFDEYEMFLKNLINHENFPRSLKTISLCGYTINCRDFRRNVDATIKQLKIYTNDDRYLYYDDTPSIILERSTT